LLTVDFSILTLWTLVSPEIRRESAEIRRSAGRGPQDAFDRCETPEAHDKI